MTRRDNCFDFLRFLFAFNVVLGHLTVIAVLPAFAPYTHTFNTYLSVTGFFVISGFLITQSYEKSSLKNYFLKRAKRLLPAYVLVITVCAIGLVSLSTLPARAYFSSPDWWQYVAANLCFLNFLHPSLPGVFESPLIHDTAVNPALWTLKIEVGFYLVLPLLMVWLHKSKRPYIVLGILYLAAVCYRECLNRYGSIAQNDLCIFMARQLPGFMSYFAAGMAAYLYKDLFLKYRHYLLVPAIVLFILEYRVLGCEIVTPLAWASIVLWAAYSLPALNNFAKYGDISYGIYIYHGPILKILLSVGCFTAIGIWSAAAVYVTLVCLAGFASWHLLENRFLKRKPTTL